MKEAAFYTGVSLEAPDVLEVAGATAVVFTRTHPLAQRAAENEDSAAIIPVPEGGVVLAVADGVGGAPGGEDASKLAVRELREQVVNGTGDLQARILGAFDVANDKIVAQSRGAATTLAVASAQDGRVRGYHAGDSVILLVGQRGHVHYQSVSHSPVGYAVESGLLDEEGALVHEERSVISNVVGSADMRIEIGPELPLAARSTLVLGSDGLFDSVGVERVGDVARKGPLLDCATDLAALGAGAMDAGSTAPASPDDLTFILFRPVARGRRS